MKVKITSELGWETATALGFKPEDYGSIKNKNCYGNQKLIWVDKKFVKIIDGEYFIDNEYAVRLRLKYDI